MKPIFRSRAVVVCLAFLLGACQTAPDYTLDELVATLVDSGFCANVERTETVPDDPNAIVPHADCQNEIVPAGLAVATFPSEDDRLFGILNLLDPGCDSRGEYMAYVFGEKWVVLTNGVWGDSDGEEVSELLFGIIELTGGTGPNIVSCEHLRETLEPVDRSDWDAELLHDAFEE
ncbi:MAG TPA: hypothetical protein VJQ57_08860 [Acidimicrobiia bacterium]|nr:hypothetical protein [Acidimicrobiia bacterium]